MIVAHVLGVPVEESVLQLVPAGAAVVTAAAAVAGRVTFVGCDGGIEGSWAVEHAGDGRLRFRSDRVLRRPHSK